MPIQSVVRGQECVIYAIKILYGLPYFYVDRANWPKRWTFAPAPAFEVLDSRTSRHWSYSARFRPLTRWGQSADSLFAIKPWADNPRDFWEGLVELWDEQIETMATAAALMDVEFARPDIELQAVPNNNGLRCGKCGAAVALNPPDEMIRCAACNAIMHPPGPRPASSAA